MPVLHIDALWAPYSMNTYIKHWNAFMENLAIKSRSKDNHLYDQHNVLTPCESAIEVESHQAFLGVSSSKFFGIDITSKKSTMIQTK